MNILSHPCELVVRDTLRSLKIRVVDVTVTQDPVSRDIRVKIVQDQRDGHLWVTPIRIAMERFEASPSQPMDVLRDAVYCRMQPRYRRYRHHRAARFESDSGQRFVILDPHA